MIRVAVVGVGYWGPNHIRNLSRIPGVQVTHICDLSQKQLKTITQTFPNLSPTTNFTDITKNPGIDAVIIATPLSSHFSLAREALLAKKHVLIEKPMTRTSKEAEELIQLAKRQKRILMVGHTFPYSNAVRKIKELIKKNVLGKLFYYSSTRINLGLIQSDINVIWDLAPHDFSILNYLFSDKPVTVQVFGSSHIRNNHVEMANVHIRYESGTVAHLYLSWLSPAKKRQILLAGSKKMIVYDELDPSEKIRIYDKGISLVSTTDTSFQSAYRYGDIVIPHVEQEEALYNELKHFISCIKTQRAPLTDGFDGLRVVKMLEATDKALKSKTEIKI